MALMVVVDETAIAEEYAVLDDVGVVPSVV